MKTTDAFKNTIQTYLEETAKAEPLFAETLKKENKNIDGCVAYIFSEVQKSGCNGFEDSEIFGMAKHYYDEDDIKPSKPTKVKVVVNHSVTLTESDIETAKKEAMDSVIAEEKAKILGKNKPKKTAVESSNFSLFD